MMTDEYDTDPHEYFKELKSETCVLCKHKGLNDHPACITARPTVGQGGIDQDPCVCVGDMLPLFFGSTLNPH